MSADGLNEYLDDKSDVLPAGEIEFDEVDRFGTPLADQPVNVKSRVYIPPRRRSATLEVKLSDKRLAKITVAKAGVQFVLPQLTGYAANNRIQLTRDVDDMKLVVELLEAAIEELEIQIENGDGK